MIRCRQDADGGVSILSEISVGDLKRLLGQLGDDDFIITGDPWYTIRREETEIGAVMVRDNELHFYPGPVPVQSVASTE